MIAPSSLVLFTHSLSSFLALCCLLICGFYALAAFLQHQLLRKAPASRLLACLPSQERLEIWLFRWLRLGFVALTFAMVSGLHGFYGYPMPFSVHKFIFGALTWFVFGILLIGRAWRGWRGITALRFTLFGLILLSVTWLIAVVFAHAG